MYTQKKANSTQHLRIRASATGVPSRDADWENNYEINIAVEISNIFFKFTLVRDEGLKKFWTLGLLVDAEGVCRTLVLFVLHFKSLYGQNGKEKSAFVLRSLVTLDM